MQLKAASARQNHFFQGGWQRRIALAHETEIHWEGICCLNHPLKMPRPRASGCQSAMGRACAATQHGGDAGIKRFLNLLWGDEVDVAVYATSRDNLAFASYDFGGWADDDGHTILCVWIASFANGGDAAFLQPNVGLVDSTMVQNQRIGDNGVHRTLRARRLRLPHAITDDLAATKFHFLTIKSEIFFHFDDEISIGQAHFVSHCWAIHLGIGAA